MLFRCVLNDEVGNAIKERWRRHQSNQVKKLIAEFIKFSENSKTLSRSVDGHP